MLGNPNYGTGSVHPFHRPLAIAGDPYPGRSEDNDQQLPQAIDVEEVWEPQTPALQQLPGAELASSLSEQQDAGPGPASSSTGARTRASDSRISRDQLLAEIEDLTAILKEKVARYSSSRANRRLAEVGERTNESAVMWIQDALEDIAATALGIEIASRELFFRASSAAPEDSKRGVGRGRTAGNAE